MPDPNLPILMFPRPQLVARRKKPGGPNKFLPASRTSQLQRIGAAVANLERAFEQRRARFRTDVTGEEPRGVLVLEVVGSGIDEFFKAVKAADIEWLGEVEQDAIALPEGFGVQHGNATQIPLRLYLTTADRSGLDRFKRLWELFRRNAPWPRGLAKWRHMFQWLRDVRFWGPQDRLQTTGVIERWREELQLNPNEPVACSIELWFHENEAIALRAQNAVTALVQQARGQILGRPTRIPQIAYHALNLRIPRNTVQSLVDGEVDDVRFVHSDDVMLFHAVAQGVRNTVHPQDLRVDVELSDRPSNLEPVAALLDGVPVENHPALRNRLIVLDSDGLAARSLAENRRHGTAMASLILHGDLARGSEPSPHKLLVRPLLIPDPVTPDKELIPAGVDVLDVTHRAVREIVAQYPHVRIINLSLGDEDRPFLHAISPWARLLDWLAVEHNLLFIVSAGNSSNDILLEVGRAHYHALPPEEQRAALLSAIRAQALNRRILSPSESINALTVGARNSDGSGAVDLPAGHYEPLRLQSSPSAISPVGGGYRRATKPDLMLPGGRVMLRDAVLGAPDDDEFPNLKITTTARRPGQLVATPGQSNKFRYTRGTSNAAAIATRSAVRLYGVIEQLRQNSGDTTLSDPAQTAVLLKALMVHSCRWRPIVRRTFEELLDGRIDPRLTSREIARHIGYGQPNFRRLVNFRENKATVLGLGSLAPEQAHAFTLPIPAGLSNQRNWGSLAFTLAFLAPTAPNRQRYRKATLEVSYEGTDGLVLDDGPDGVDKTASAMGTVQHIVREGRGIAIVGTNDSLNIQVNCRADAATSREVTQEQISVRYALLVTLQARAGIDIFSVVRQRLRTQVRVQPR